MRNNVLIRSLAAVSGLVMMASLAACGDNTASTDASSTDSGSKTESISGNFAGAGASSQQAAVDAWIAGYNESNPDAKISYEPSGSGAGVKTFLTGATAWAGSDKALADDEIEQSKSVCASGQAFDVPVYISPIAVVFNLKGVSDAGKHINMDAATIAKIFDGFSQVGDLGTVAVKVGDKYSEISAEAGSKVIDDSELDADAKGDNRVVVKINHATEADGAYPIVLVSYDIACPAYKDASTAKFVKSWLTYVTSDAGQKAAAQAAGSAPLPSSLTSKIAKSIEAIKTE